MNQFEITHVTNVYSNIAEHFSSTRYSHWTCVKNYLDLLQKNNLSSEDKINFLDFGCGNGKYLSFGEKFNTYALDNCSELLDIVSIHYPHVNIIKADVSDEIININLQYDYFDSIISVAVIHHLSTETRRIKMITNIIQMLKSGGTCLITAWATNSYNTTNNKSKWTTLDTPNDYLVGWNSKFERYYHLFEKDEFEYLVHKTGLGNQVKLIEKIFECDNWVIVLEKL